MGVSPIRKHVRSVLRPPDTTTRDGTGRKRTGRLGSGPKRLCMTIVLGPRPLLGPRDLYSRDGVMQGLLSPSPDKFRVGIVAQAGWSEWYAVAAGLNWETVWVAVCDGPIGQAWPQELASLSIPHLTFTDFSSGLVNDSKLDILLLDILLLDGRLLQKSSGILMIASLRIVLGTSFPQRIGTASRWSSHSLAWTHSDCGGVTSGSGILNYIGRSCTPLALPNRPRWQLSSILSTTEGGRAIPPPAPGPWPPQVAFTPRSGCHGDGLFPAGSANPWVDLPDCLSPTGWARRKMTSKELLMTANIPVDIQDSLFHRSGVLGMSFMLRSPIGMLHLLGVQLTGYL